MKPSAIRELSQAAGSARLSPVSCDFAVWYPHTRLSNSEACDVYVRLCEEDLSGVMPHPAVDAFYAELTAKHPELAHVPEDRVDDRDLCPWSCDIDRSPGHLVMCSVWSKAESTGRTVHELARKHGLAVYDPQSDRITYPDGSTGGVKPWWKLW